MKQEITAAILRAAEDLSTDASPKKLVSEGKAYPCFLTEEEIASIRAEQEQTGQNPGIYGKWAKSRDLSLEEIERNCACRCLTL